MTMQNFAPTGQEWIVEAEARLRERYSRRDRRLKQFGHGPCHAAISLTAFLLL